MAAPSGAKPSLAASPSTDAALSSSELHHTEDSTYVKKVKNIRRAPTPDEDDNVARHDEEMPSRSSFFMFLLTVGAFGLQFAWSIEMSSGSPFLLSIGLDKALIAVVWIAGPLSGVLVQPYIGIKSDRCRSRFGKRRPFIVGGALAGMFSLLALSWSTEIIAGIYRAFGKGPDSRIVRVSTMSFAVFLIYVLDFTINVLQAGLRAIAVDSTPSHQQQISNAWISRMVGAGNILGMFCGGMTLQKNFFWLGHTQFQILCALGSMCIALTVATTVFSIHEKDPRDDPEPANANDGFRAQIKTLWRAVFKLPPQVAAVCKVQIVAWLGWFPFLFYTSTYVGQIYVNPFFEKNNHLSAEEIDQLWDAGTRKGSIALLAFAIVGLVASIILPMIITAEYEDPRQNGAVHLSPLDPKLPLRIRFSRGCSAIMKKLRIKGLTLRRLWLLSHINFGVAMWCTLLIKNVTMSILLVGFVGISWAVTMWAPFALISAEVSKRDAIRRGAHRPPGTHAGQLQAAKEDDDRADTAGIVLGLHNVAISVPQVIATLVGAVLFKWLQKPRGMPNDQSVGWFLRLAGVAALFAAYMTTKVADENSDDDGEAREPIMSGST